MLQKVREVPPRFYQFALLNIGLILALSKDLSLIHIISSLVFILLVTAPIAIYYQFLRPENLQLVHEDIQAKLNNVFKSLGEYIKNWDEVDERKRI
jgi:C4-dicarboxylate transporter